MAAITQPRAQFPFTGQRYGAFNKIVAFPDFMHGTLSVRQYLSGDIDARSYLSGKLNTGPHLNGDVRTNP